MAMALSILNQYKNVKLEVLTVSMMKPGQKAPAVLVDDVIMAEDEGKGDGIADKQEVINELIKHGAVAYSKED